MYEIALIWVCLMQRRLIYKIVTRSLMSGLLMANVVMADVVTSDSDTEKSLLKQSPRLLAGQWNPWVLPAAPEETTGFQCPADWQSGQTQGKSMGTQGQDQPPEFQKSLSGRFVTPGILESLKQQQIQTQMTPSYGSYRQLRPRQPMSQQPMPQQPVTRLPGKSYYYGEPSYGMGSVNPLYDAPAVSPWGGGPDVIYRGQSFPDSFSGVMPGSSSPWVPNEAVGGLPPIHVPPFAGSSNWRELNSTNTNNAEAENIEKRKDSNVFNPFTFRPNRSWPP